jgi:tRNA-Thr(GGU) m(6)t(6)A37 methyltransferase TsaA
VVVVGQVSSGKFLSLTVRLLFELRGGVFRARSAGVMEIERIGVVRSCFGEKFGTPRQPGLCPSAWGELVFDPACRREEMIRGLDGFSHVWLIFGFHGTAGAGWHPTVRPPRLGGNKRVGVFASRSPFRPNGLGLSLARLDGIDRERAEAPVLLLGGVDVIDGTPVFDIKPYLPYCEAPDGALGGFASAPQKHLDVEIDAAAAREFDALPDRARALIREALACDPRPAAGAAEPGRIYGAMLCGRNVRFVVEDGARCRVVEVG